MSRHFRNGVKAVDANRTANKIHAGASSSDQDSDESILGSSVPVDGQEGGEPQDTHPSAEGDDVEQTVEAEGEVVAEEQDLSSSAIPGLFDDDDFNIDEIVNEEVEAGEVSNDPTKLVFNHIWLSNIDKQCADDNVDEVLAQIGFKSFVQTTAGMEQNEERMFEYPEPPDRSIKFGALLKKCGYAEDVLEQYAEAADIEVRLCNRQAASKECHVTCQVVLKSLHSCIQITGIQTDSRRVEAGNLFVCIEGAHADGHHFIPDAISNGCSLILAQMRVPGAELALYTDASPVNPELSELYQEPFYQMADNDIMTMEACSEEMRKVFDKMEAFGEANKLSEEDIETLQVEGAMRNISSALNYDFSHWENQDGACCPLMF